jgi:hypothetical protein
MEEISKPESYERLEQNEVALFRSSPCKDWAPPPNPLAAFASFFNEDGRGLDSLDADSNRRGSASARKASWGPRDMSKTRAQSDMSHSGDNKEESWRKDDSSRWGKGQRSSSTRRSASDTRSWSQTRGTSWDYSYSHTDGGYHTPHWIKKESKLEDETPLEALADAQSWPTVWVKKNASKLDDGSRQDEDGKENDEIGKEPNDEKEKRQDESDITVRKPSWADKVKGVKSVDEVKAKDSTPSVIASPSSSPLAKAKNKVDSNVSPMIKKMPNNSIVSPIMKSLSNDALATNQSVKANNQIRPAPGLEAEIKTESKTSEAESKTSGTPTWADRMRKSVSQ